MEEDTQKKIIIGATIVAGSYFGVVYQYSLWKEEAIAEHTVQSGVAQTNVTQAQMDQYLAGTKMVEAFTGTPKAAPIGAIATVCLPLATIVHPVLNLWKPYAI